MIFLRRKSGGPFNNRLFQPVVIFLFWAGIILQGQAENPPYKIELRVTDTPTLQLLDNQGQIYSTLQLGTVRKRITVQDTHLLASFGEDSQHHPIVMLGLDPSTDHPVSFLFGKNIIVTSSDAMLTIQLSADHSNAQVSPSLMGQVWLNGKIIPRGESKKIQLYSGSNSSDRPDSVIPTSDQPKPTIKDFSPIQPPSI